MANDQIRFDDGAAYEHYMGRWSRLAGEVFLDWLAPAQRLRWLDVGCGNGAFTELLYQGCAPDAVDGIDPSEGQIRYASARSTLGAAKFHVGDAMALPFEADSFDVAVMPLVIFFVPDPAKGVAEMARVVRPGGSIAAYAWDLPGGGFPYYSLQVEMRASGLQVLLPPSPDSSRIETMRDLWTAAGLRDVHTREITVQRSFDDFADYWIAVLGSPSAGGKLAQMSPDGREALKARLRATLPVDSQGRITYSAKANAVKGTVSI